MDYQEARAYLREVEERLGSDYSLMEVTQLSECMGRPDRETRIIHIAGTNGKGSVGTFLCQVLALSGYRVGRFASPAVFHERECIQNIYEEDGVVICRDISEEETADAVTELREHCERMVSAGYHQPTAFEMETVMAFQKFVDWGVDVAVVECGLGGRTDATNIVEHPLLCVFTPISIDHTRILGNTPEEIAAEKYGIVMEGTRVVSPVSSACADMLETVCKKRQAELHFVREDTFHVVSCTVNGSRFKYRGREYEVGRAGIYQAENAAIAVEASEQLMDMGFDGITRGHIQGGLRTAEWRGRFDVVKRDPLVVVDGAHNPAAVLRLMESLESYFPGEKFDFIMGVFSDKDYRREVETLAPLMHRVYTVTAPGKRGLSGEELGDSILECAEGQGRKVDVFLCDGVAQACRRALLGIDAGRKLVVCGSLSIVGEACQYFKMPLAASDVSVPKSEII